LKKGVSLGQGYGRQASGILSLRPEPPSPKWALATKAGSPCGLAERIFLKIPRGYLKNPSDMGEGHANDHEGCDLS